MSAAVTLAGWFLIFGVYFAIAFGLAVLIGKAIRGPQELDTQGRDRLGQPSSISSLVEEQQRRANRAQFRHATRHHKDVA